MTMKTVQLFSCRTEFRAIPIFSAKAFISYKFCLAKTRGCFKVHFIDTTWMQQLFLSVQSRQARKKQDERNHLHPHEHSRLARQCLAICATCFRQVLGKGLQLFRVGVGTLCVYNDIHSVWDQRSLTVDITKCVEETVPGAIIVLKRMGKQ